MNTYIHTYTRTHTGGLNASACTPSPPCDYGNGLAHIPINSSTSNASNSSTNTSRAPTDTNTTITESKLTGTCYRYFTFDQKNLTTATAVDSARAQCVSWGGGLAVISNLEQNAVATRVARSAAFVALRTRDASDDDVYVWDATGRGNDTVDMQWAYWATGEPVVGSVPPAG